MGTRARVEAFTEVGFSTRTGEKKLRPDGLITMQVGSRQWSVLVEAKVGNNDLTAEQVESYLDLAQENGIDAVVTISNQFASSPAHHPIAVKGRARSKVQLYHWSWMYLLTEADLLLSNGVVSDTDQRYLLSELVRFLTHESAGVKGFDAMPKAWTEIAQMIRAGGAISQTSPEAIEVVGAWHQEVRDLSLILSRQVGVEVANKLPRALASDSNARMKSDLAHLADTKSVAATLTIPDAAGPLEVIADLSHRTVNVSVRMQAPADKKSATARVNWLLRQLQKSPAEDVHIRLNWPGRGPHTQHSLSALRENPALAGEAKPKAQVSSFDVCLVRQLGGRFVQSKNFIRDLEEIVPSFYLKIVQHLRAWQPPAPKIRDGRTTANDVAPEALSNLAPGSPSWSEENLNDVAEPESSNGNPDRQLARGEE